MMILLCLYRLCFSIVNRQYLIDIVDLLWFQHVTTNIGIMGVKTKTLPPFWSNKRFLMDIWLEIILLVINFEIDWPFAVTFVAVNLCLYLLAEDICSY